MRLRAWSEVPARRLTEVPQMTMLPNKEVQKVRTNAPMIARCMVGREPCAQPGESREPLTERQHTGVLGTPSAIEARPLADRLEGQAPRKFRGCSCDSQYLAAASLGFPLGPHKPSETRPASNLCRIVSSRWRDRISSIASADRERRPPRVFRRKIKYFEVVLLPKSLLRKSQVSTTVGAHVERCRRSPIADRANMTKAASSEVNQIPQPIQNA